MSLSRRSLLGTAAAAAPAVLAKPSSYTAGELEKRIARRDFRGITKQDLPTPVLVLDEEVFAKNIRHMAQHCKATGLNLRAHVKVHRSADVGKRQIEAGAIGLCCATIAECEWMSANGLRGLLWTTQPVGPDKTARVIALARKDPGFLCAVDDAAVVESLNEAAGAAKVKAGVVVDIDVGIGRQGVLTAQEALELAQRIGKSPHLVFGGLMGYSGAASHAKGWENRRKVSQDAVAKLLDAVALCRKAGIQVPIVTGGSTGSYNIDCDIHGITELQAGSYALMDAVYQTIGSKDGSPAFHDFGCALTVLTRVISRKYPNKASIDAGNKAMTRDTDMVKNWPGVQVRPAGAEYGMLVWKETDREPRLGDQAELVISNLDMSVNTFDRMYVCRNDQLVDVFSVLGRSGPAQR
jgi:D-serine deaminase-like pyridoxal phosphate-dependent protein